MISLKKTLLTSALMIAFGSAQATMVWQPLPKPKQPQGEHAGHGTAQQGQQTQGQNHRRGGKPFRLIDGEGAQAKLWAPSLALSNVELNKGKSKIAGTGVNNYHALIALRESENSVDAAIRYLYMHGKPSGESPSKLTNASKLQLEIMPHPLPREHWRYQALKEATFVIKWQGMPLANSEVTLTTSNGTELNLISSSLGIISLPIPDDFSEIKPGRRNNKPAEFVLTASHQQADKVYQTTLSAPYYVSPSYWQSNQLALWMMGIGFIGGLGLVRLIPRPKKGRKA